jgi:DNA polymerase-3 subunit beta
VEVKTEEIRIVTGVIEGKFPAYERVIPSPDKLPLKARISRSDLMTTLKLSLITADEMSRRLSLIFDDGLTVTSTNAEQEQSTLKVPVEWQKDPMTIHVNGGYLTDALKAVEGDECEINMGENQHAVTIRSQVDPNFTCVVMQMSR